MCTGSSYACPSVLWKGNSSRSVVRLRQKGAGRAYKLREQVGLVYLFQAGEWVGLLGSHSRTCKQAGRVTSSLLQGSCTLLLLV